MNRDTSAYARTLALVGAVVACEPTPTPPPAASAPRASALVSASAAPTSSVATAASVTVPPSRLPLPRLGASGDTESDGASRSPGPAPVVAKSAPPIVGADDAAGARVALPTAVVLYGAPAKDGIRFSPVLCAKAGVLAHGVACGELMPNPAPVRVTSGLGGAARTLTVARGTTDFDDQAGGQVFKAPRGPECCMYNACMGETIPYFARGKSLPTGGKVLAVWPPNAEVGLRPLPRGGAPDAAVPRTWSNEDAPARVEQLAVAGDQAFASVTQPRCMSCAAVYVRDHGPWRPVGGAAPGPDGYVALAATDVDHDGRLEAIVYERWRNDDGLFVLGNDWSKPPAYRYSCGNL